MIFCRLSHFIEPDNDCQERPEIYGYNRSFCRRSVVFKVNSTAKHNGLAEILPDSVCPIAPVPVMVYNSTKSHVSLLSAVSAGIFMA